MLIRLRIIPNLYDSPLQTRLIIQLSSSGLYMSNPFTSPRNPERLGPLYARSLITAQFARQVANLLKRISYQVHRGCLPNSILAISESGKQLPAASYKPSVDLPAPQRFLTHSALEFPMILQEYFGRPSPYGLRTIA